MSILIILEQYKYLIIIPVVIVEGPIITIISGFLLYLGYLDAFFLYPVLVLGDLIGDSIYYCIGRYGTDYHWIKKVFTFLGYNKRTEKFLKTHFENHRIKTLLIAKISHGLGIPVQITAGMAKVNFLEYLTIELLGTLPKTLILLLVGFYLGDSYEKINNYLSFYASAVIIVLLLAVLYLILRRLNKNYFK